MSRFEQRAEQHLQHPEVAAGYGEMETELQLVRALNALRQQQHLTHEELAQRMGRQRASLSRLLSAEHPNPRLDTLSDLLVALGITAEVHLRPAREGEPPIQVDLATPA